MDGEKDFKPSGKHADDKNHINENWEPKKDDHRFQGRSGGNMGAGQSGKENLGTEKPSDARGLGSHKPRADDEPEEDDAPASTDGRAAGPGSGA